jgi:hypothetical protein
MGRPKGFLMLPMLAKGLTSGNDEEKAMLLRQLLASQCGNGLMHESVNVNNPQVCFIFQVFLEFLLHCASSDQSEDCQMRNSTIGYCLQLTLRHIPYSQGKSDC